MKIILHAGMHKTGSSSIQMTLKAHSLPGTYYHPVVTGNHSGLVATMFESPKDQVRLTRLQGKTPEDIARQKGVFEKQITTALCSGKYDTCIISAERISNFRPDAVERMRAFFARFSDDIEVIAYVRPPVSFMTSAFQQLVKGAQAELRMTWPNYRSTFEPLDQVFGGDRVRLGKFDRASLKDGNVVADFFDMIGMTLNLDHVVTNNESLSLEALALLFAQRNLGDGFVRGFAGAQGRNNAFIDALRGIGSARLVLAPDLVNPVIDENRDDLDWMEERLGQPLLDAPKTADRMIASAEDLLAIAEENQAVLSARLIEMIKAPGTSPRDQLVRNLNLMRALCYASLDKSRS